MARDRGNINTAIWTDDHYRALTRDQQWLYELLLTHPALSYAGVVDWRPGRIAQFAAGTTASDVDRIGAELQAEKFIYIDADTEEVLIRSFTRHDGLLKQPRLAVSMVNAYGAIASTAIREIFVHELRRMFAQFPDLKAFESTKVRDLLKLPARPIEDFIQALTHPVTQGLTQGFTPPLTQGFTPNDGQRLGLRTSTATSTSSKDDAVVNSPSVSDPGEQQPIPHDFKPDRNCLAWAKANYPDVDTKRETEKFKDHHQAKGSRYADWQHAWRSWIKREHEYQAARKTNEPPSQWDTLPKFTYDPDNPDHAYAAVEPAHGWGTGGDQ